MKLFGAIVFSAALLMGTPALAANPETVKLCVPVSPTSCVPVDSGHGLPIVGTITASLGGFTPSASGARMTPFTVNLTDSSGTLPSGAVAVVSNVGTTNPMYCNVNGVAATVSDQLIQPNSWFAFTIPAAITTLHCIATGGTTTANGVGGSGLATGAGGGGGSGGGGGGTVVQGNAGSNAQAWWVRLGDATNGPAAITLSGADAASNTASGLQVYDRPSVFNGTTYDRLRSGTATGSLLVNNPTAANLNATVVGTGTFAVQATLQAAATTAIGKVDPNTIGTWGLQVATQNSATPTNGGLVLGQFNTTPTTITSGNVSPLQLDNAGNLLVNIKAGASSGAVAQGSTTSGQTGGLTQAAATSAAPTYTTATTNPLSMDLSGNLRVTVASAVGLAQGSTTSGQTGSLIMGAVTTSPPTYTTAQTSPISLDVAGNVRTAVLAALPAGTNLLGKVGIDQTTQGTTNGVVQLASTGGGTSHAHVIAANSNNSTLVSTGAHNLYAVQVGNNSATIAYLKIYDKATAPTCGTDTPIKTLIIPASTSGAGSNVNIDAGASVTLGLGYCVTGGIADTDNTSVAATSIAINIDYK